MNMVAKTAPVPNGGYRAWCPNLPGCVAWGDSDEEAIRRLEDAVRGYLSSLDVAPPKELFLAHQGAA
ncbi:MAG: type II toxin-antitoxin system HicB family antitoxin [Planctomycetota bacterium]|nr:type II toxin-antitoxin system HicB family antitoxin [Planctomycetota bacterium]